MRLCVFGNTREPDIRRAIVRVHELAWEAQVGPWSGEKKHEDVSGVRGVGGLLQGKVTHMLAKELEYGTAA